MKKLYLGATLLTLASGCGSSGDGSGNTEPDFISTNEVSVYENQTNALILQATDSDGDTLLYSIEGSDADWFHINSTSGEVIFKTPPDYETKNHYTFIATVSDGNLSTNQVVNIQILDIENEPLVWLPPAGNATVDYEPQQPFLKILSTIDDSAIGSVSQGRELFIAQWLVAPSSRITLDGLGPLFNANSCTACHIANGRVPPFHENEELDNSFLIRTSDIEGNTHPIYGGQLQTQATSGNAEASISWSQNQDTRQIEFSIISDSSLDGYNVGARMAPHLLGMGLLDLVEENTILEYADENDDNNDGISGRPHYVTEEGETRLGKFGWKAINSTLRTQNAGALSQDMGLTSPVHEQENCTTAQTVCATEANGGNPEVSEDALAAIVNFMTALGVPDRRITDQTTFDNGSRLFQSVGCASCHRPAMTTGQSEKFSALLNHQIIYPYTDLLLHDMGEALDDGVIEKSALSQEWRTPPLWGIGIVEQSEGARFLHDGRAATIEEAISWHGGEAQAARQAYQMLDESEKARLLEFLRAI